MALPGGYGLPGMRGMGGGFTGYGGTGGGFPGYWDLGGGYLGGGIGGGGPSLGPLEPSLNPTLRCFGATGLPIKLTIDTGAGTSIITTEAFQRHYAGRVQIDRSNPFNISGIGGNTQQCLGRFNMTLTVPAPNGQNLQVTGECWIAPSLPYLEVLLGMPFLKLNNMHLTWDEGGVDYVEIKKTKVPIVMKNGSA